MTPAPHIRPTRHDETGQSEKYAQNMLQLACEGARATTALMARFQSSSTSGDIAHAAKSMSGVAAHWMTHPDKLIDAQCALLQGYAGLWGHAWARMLGNEDEPIISPSPSDKRFSDPEWTSNPYFDFWRQAYQLTTRWSDSLLEQTEGLDAQSRQAAEFYVRLATTAMSPSNFPLTNPEVVRETLATNGANLVEGMRRLAGDLEKPGDLVMISQTDPEAFEVGRNLATTPGKIVFQNDIFQLIQYTPATDRVREIPLLIVPPWINKFYILDLSPQKSFVKFAVDQGFTVFLISWVNPDERLAGKTFEDYVSEGLLAAADAIQRETQIEKCNVLGYCIGGTLLGTTLAYLAALNEERFASATFLTTQFDFTMAGDLSIFAAEDTIAGIESLMAERGYLDSSRLAGVFNMMRPQDLIWPYVVNNYLLGRKPVPFDILYWNQDSTRMPAANHAFYLRNFYGGNQLAKGELVFGSSNRGSAPAVTASTEDHIVFYLREKRGRTELAPVAMSIENIRLNLNKVRLPIYELAAKEDHIAPAPSVFNGSRLFGGNVTFVLAGSGHIAGVINPPGKPKYQYWTSDTPHTATFEEWSAQAKENPGSWWLHWADWLEKQSGTWIEARRAGSRIGTIEDAPGSYVKVKA